MDSLVVWPECSAREHTTELDERECEWGVLNISLSCYRWERDRNLCTIWYRQQRSNANRCLIKHGLFELVFWLFDWFEICSGNEAISNWRSRFRIDRNVANSFVIEGRIIRLDCCVNGQWRMLGADVVLWISSCEVLLELLVFQVNQYICVVFDRDDRREVWLE